MHVKGGVATAGASDSGSVAPRAPGTRGASVHQQKLTPNCRRNGSEVLPVRRAAGTFQGVTEETHGTANAGRGTGTPRCSATVDPVFSFDLAYFDTSPGEQGLSSHERYRLVCSPEPEPGTPAQRRAMTQQPAAARAAPAAAQNTAASPAAWLSQPPASPPTTPGTP